METAKRPEWTGKAVMYMHINNITRKDIADELGVSTAYVSMVLNGRPVKEKTQQRIENAIYKLATVR